MSGSSGSSGTNAACAACKYQRRKCSPDCPLSPYFPPDQPKRFQNVHKLFGVSNILRILKHVDPSKREDTVKSIIYEADTREKDPVHGCLGVTTILQNQVSKLKDELAVAREQMYLLQQQHTFNQQARMEQIVGSLGASSSVVDVSSGQEANVLMHHSQQYSDMNQLNSDFTKSNPLSVSSFEPDQYLRNDGFDQIKLSSASTSTFDVSRYIRGESLVQQSALLGQVKLDEGSVQYRAPIYGMADVGSSFISTPSDDNLTQHVDCAFNTPDPYAMAIRRRGSGFLNLTATSEAELKRSTGSHGGVPEHELRRAGVYLTLTNN
ncbi:uncharacterized protein [Physcomitrium patens]|uniref:LOB domain-containing protein n=1 Tax=Physcomitrium patens TaxID=3218 RepID=A0A2K1IID1_PHYPA|nr:protein IAL1-like [Physcomitrium patens]PNR29033.1 hypothetical protein PHYPA_027725 [Physcomitrium patens]|eukprot:XP_024362031.1 protein IAL1-like [Physcomitrella patens]